MCLNCTCNQEQNNLLIIISFKLLWSLTPYIYAFFPHVLYKNNRQPRIMSKTSLVFGREYNIHRSTIKKERDRDSHVSWFPKKGKSRKNKQKTSRRGARTWIQKRVSVAADHEVDSIHFLRDLFVHRVTRVADGDQNVDSVRLQPLNLTSHGRHLILKYDFASAWN